MASFIAAGSSHAATHYVKSTASGASNGTSWTNAYTRLQDALAVAVSGDQIWIASGTYKPSTTGVRTQSFNVPSGVGLYGGFVGTEATLADRTSAVAATILSGDLLGNDNGNRARTEATRLDNTYNVVRVSAASATVTFDGLTIQSGHSETYGDSYDRGAGIHFLASTAGNVVITNCIIRWNTARSSSGWFDDSNHAFIVTATQLVENQAERGGAAGFGGSFTIQNSAFIGNRTENSRDGYQWGGGLFIANGTGQVINCVFESNYAAEEGGAVYNHGNASFINCTFVGNSAVRWSSALHDRTNSASVRNCIFWGNTGTTYPISADGGSPGTPVFNSLVQGGYTAGGAASIISSDPLFTNNTTPLGADGKLGTADDGLRLGPGSPAINAGNNAYVPVVTTTDIGGALRISGTVDMGAYETLPVITTQPQSITVAQNASASFSVTATGTGTLSYQWQKDGVDIPGTTSSTYSLASAKPWHIGDYTVKVTDSNGAVTSNAATLNLPGINGGLWRGLIGYYPFNGNANDQTSLTNHGTAYLSSATTDRDGKTNAAWAFVGNTASRIVVSKQPQHNFSAEATVSMWVKFNEPWSYHAEDLIWNRPAFQSYGFVIGVNQDDSVYGSSNYNYFGTAFWTNTGDAQASGPNVPFAMINRWNLVTVTFSRGSLNCYVNGVLSSSGSAGASLVNSPSDLIIGGASNPVSGAYQRDVDDVRLFNRALAAGEVAALYAAENAPNNWRQTHFGTTANSGNAADGADPDHDGMNNLMEFALNLPPNAASQVPASVQPAGGNLEYTYTRGTAAYNGGMTFQVEWSDDLTTWFTAGVVESLLSENETHQQVKATLPAGSSGRRFVHLRVQ